MCVSQIFLRTLFFITSSFLSCAAIAAQMTEDQQVARAVVRYQLAQGNPMQAPPTSVVGFLQSYYTLASLVTGSSLESLQSMQSRQQMQQTLEQFDAMLASGEGERSRPNMDAVAFAIQDPDTIADDLARKTILETYSDLIMKRAAQAVVGAAPSRIKINGWEVGRFVMEYTFWGFSLKAASYLLMGDYSHHEFLNQQLLTHVLAFSVGGAIFSVIRQAYWQSVDHVKASIAQYYARVRVKFAKPREAGGGSCPMLFRPSDA